jgi:glycosyltransferase involved in cell wall biosynthesis
MHAGADGGVSVVVPCFNCQAYVGEALDSILRQTRKPDEINVVDDGSTDASAAEIARFGAHVRYVRQDNQGIGAARNRGIAMSTGALIAFLDADDLWPADSLAARMDPMARDAALAASFGHVEQFISPEIDAAARAQFQTPPTVQPGRLIGAMLIRRAVFGRVGLFDASLKVGETLDWTARLDENRVRTAMVDGIVLRRRIHGANTVATEKRLHSDYLRVLRATIARRRATAGG